MTRRTARPAGARARIQRGAALLPLLLPLAAAGEGAVPLFGNDALLPVRLEAPLTTLVRDRSDTTELDGRLYYTDENGAEQALDVKVSARGRYRRKPETCAFPPVRFNFRKGQVEDTLFAGVNKLKLVTHCKESDSYEQNVLEEYLAYRILNTLTDHSFRVRLLRIDYVDNERDGRTDKRYAFLIEDDDLLEERLRLVRAEVRGIDYGQLQPEQATLVSVFEYMIGNTDFSMVLGPEDDTCCHNAVLFSGEPGRYLAIPYDFDFSGLVNARYASPNPRLRIRRVTTRLYRGHCSFNAYVEEAVADISSRREQVMALIGGVPGMDERTGETARRYLDKFYEEMAEPGGVDKHLLRECS